MERDFAHILRFSKGCAARYVIKRGYAGPGEITEFAQTKALDTFKECRHPERSPAVVLALISSAISYTVVEELKIRRMTRQFSEYEEERPTI